MKHVTFATALVIGTLGSSSVLATTDVKGGKDHPLISRYQNSYIQEYSETNYDEYRLAIEPVAKDAELPPVEHLEGRITTIAYEANSARESVLKIYRNYEHALKKAGFQTVFACANDECGTKFIPKLYGSSTRYGRYGHLDLWNMHGSDANYRFLSAKLEAGGDPVYVSLLVGTKTFGDYPPKIALDVIETKDMELDLVTVNANTLADALGASGKAVLDGVYFDPDKAVLKSESDDAVAEIAKYLQQHPENQVFIVGHTDNTGAYQHNLGLSRKRAEAVVDALSTTHGIAKERLTPVGIGEVSPQTSNLDDEGQAKNRRVEMVLGNSD